MKTFAEYLPTMTAREREIVEAYDTAVNKYLSGTPDDGQPWPLEQMRATPPAKEPVSTMEEISTIVVLHAGHLCAFVPCIRFDENDRVRVVKIEEVKQ